MTRETTVFDEASKDVAVAPTRFDVTSFGADYDVEGLVKRLERGDIFIPPFQRNYVWNIKEASRFIESLLLGLPVPAVFLAKEPESNRLLVIDGQQRLKTLQFFFAGYFNPREGDRTKRVFRLVEVQNEFEGKTYSELDEPDRIRLNDSVIHAITVKQDAPEGDNTSVFHIFERLNSEGRKLAAQEMRTALYHGPLITKIREMNEHKSWRIIFGKHHNRLKDEELILRFIALLVDGAIYERPMAEFLNKFTGRNRFAPKKTLDLWYATFATTCDAAHAAFGKRAFRPERALNAAVFDAVMVGLARRLKRGPVEEGGLKRAYRMLLENKEFLARTLYATSDETSVKGRIQQATTAFADL
jgi:hypothetical protein